MLSLSLSLTSIAVRQALGISVVQRNITTLDSAVSAHYAIPTITFAADFSYKFYFVTTNKATTTAIIGNAADSDFIRLESTGSPIKFGIKLAGFYASTADISDVAEGVIHEGIVARSGSTLTTRIDGELKDTQTVSTGTVTFDYVGRCGGGFPSYYDGEFLDQYFWQNATQAGDPEHHYKLDEDRSDNIVVDYGTAGSLGADVVIGGTFDTDTNWSKGTGWSIADGKASHAGGDGNLQQSVLTIGRQYLVTYTLSDITQGNVRLILGGTVGDTRSANGSYTELLTATVESMLYVNTLNAFIGSIDDIKVEEADGYGFAVNISESMTLPYTWLRNEWVSDNIAINGAFDADTDWSKGAGWSIGSGVAAHTGGDGSLAQAMLGVGNDYYIGYDILTVTGGHIRTIAGGTVGVLNGRAEPVKQELQCSVESLLYLNTLNAFDGTIDNIVTQRVIHSTGQEIHTLGDSFATPVFVETLRTNLANRGVRQTLDGVGGSTLAAQKIRFDSTPEYYDSTLAIMDGGLDDTSAAAITAIDGIAAHLSHSNWVWVVPSPGENIDGSAERIAWEIIVVAIKAHVGTDHHVDCLATLQTGGDGSAEDNADIANNIVPRSLRIDEIHETDIGMALRTKAVAAFIKLKGY